MESKRRERMSMNGIKDKGGEVNGEETTEKRGGKYDYQ